MNVKGMARKMIVIRRRRSIGRSVVIPPNTTSYIYTRIPQKFFVLIVFIMLLVVINEISINI